VSFPLNRFPIIRSFNESGGNEGARTMLSVLYEQERIVVTTPESAGFDSGVLCKTKGKNDGL
jgi:hypothetical protein